MTAKTKKFVLSKEHWMLLVLFGCSHLCAGLGWSLLAPFFPKLASSKGVSASVYGFIIGVFELVNFLSAPFLGKNIKKIGSTTMFKVGILVMGSSCVSFGFLDKIPLDNRTAFIALSFTIRIIEALGQTSFFIATYAICAQNFGDKVSVVFSFLEALSGFGSIIGPAVGGFLFECFGYLGPFAFMGVTLLLAAFVSFSLLPKSADSTVTSHSFCKILSIPAIAISAFGTAAVNFSVGFNSTLLSPTIEQFNLSPSISSLIFVVQGGMYAVSINFWGYAARRIHPKIFCVIGGILVAVGFLILGPSPFIPMKRTLWLIIIALILQGLGVAAVSVSTYVDCNQEAIANGLPESIETYGLIGGLWTSAFALGLFSGSSAAGVLNDHLGFRNSTTVVVGLNLLLALLSFISYSTWKIKRIAYSEIVLDQL